MNSVVYLALIIYSKAFSRFAVYCDVQAGTRVVLTFVPVDEILNK